MKIIFCSSVYNMADYDRLTEKSKVPLSLADHNLNRNIVRGLDECMDQPLDLINHVPIPSYPNYPKILFKKQAWHHTQGAADINCGFLNLPVFKHISRAITTYREIKRAIKESADKDICLMTYDVHIGTALAIAAAKRRFPQVKSCLIMPDVPTQVLAASTGGNITRAAKLRAKIKLSFIKPHDSYVFLTEAMKELVDVAGKAYTVVEGIYNNHLPPLAEKTTEQKVIFYSGQLNPCYNMEGLLDAFLEIYALDPSYAFWICGHGRLSERIRELAKQCPGIRYYGYVSGERVRQLQAEATVLVNPRQNTGNLTRYSFPSKTMEYVASGRPVVGYKLDGIPEEYDRYIQYVPDNSVAALRDKLMEVCELPAQTRAELGQRSRAFILENKTPKKQCEKIKAMVDGLF